MKLFATVVLLAVLHQFTACSDASDAGLTAGNQPENSQHNHLSMSIDGQAWEADNAVSGAYHVAETLGPGILNLSGQKGTGKTQQDFVINLYNTTGPGTYTVNIAPGTQKTNHQNVAQFANLTATNYLCGGALQGSQLTIVITKATKLPQELEGRFSGTMQCVEGNTLHITNGKFYYHE